MLAGAWLLLVLPVAVKFLRKTAEIAARFKAKYVSEPRRGQALARNTGVANTTADIIAFTDDDCVPAKDWLSQSLKNFSNPDVWACTGRVIQHHREGAANLFEEVAGQDLGTQRRVFTRQDTIFNLGFLLGNLTKIFAKHLKSGAPIPFGIGHGSSMIFRSETFKQLGGFNEQFGNSVVKYAIEDTELFYRILKSGHSIVYECDAVVSHKHKLTAEEVFKTRYIYSYVGAALLWQHRGDARMLIMFYVAWFNFCSKICNIKSSGIRLWHNPSNQIYADFLTDGSLTGRSKRKIWPLLKKRAPKPWCEQSDSKAL